MTDPVRTATRSYFLRRIYAGRDLELFLVTAIATILIVRAALAATGWPQLGGGKIHFAHLLWGGLGMLIALVLLMALHGRRWRQLAALSAGIGFGLFIDELGKFITSDNDYFFQPVVALIYVVFVVLFLIARTIDAKVAISPQAALVNAYDVAKEAAIRDLDETERSAGLSLLATCDQSDPAVRHLAQVFADTGSPSRQSSEPYQRLKARLRTSYDSLVNRRWFKALVVAYLALIPLSGLASVAAATIGQTDQLDFSEWGQLISGVVSSAFVIVGFARWHRSRLAAYRWFERGLLVIIFVYEPLAFYQAQLTNSFGLVIVLLTYATVRVVIREEETGRGSRQVGAEAHAS